MNLSGDFQCVIMKPTVPSTCEINSVVEAVSKGTVSYFAVMYDVSPHYRFTDRYLVCNFYIHYHFFLIHSSPLRAMSAHFQGGLLLLHGTWHFLSWHFLFE